MMKRLWPDMPRQSCQVFPVYSIRNNRGQEWSWRLEQEQHDNARGIMK